MHKKIKLKNNIRLILSPLKETATVSLLVLVKVGSRYESSEQAGISHFVEHMMFKGTKKRPNSMAITRELDGVGAEFNAFTGKDYTGYYIKADASHLNLAINVLSDILLNSKFNSHEIEKEKGVIIEEINMYEDNPLMYIDDLLEQTMFDKPLGRSIAGKRQSVKNLERKDFIDYLKKFYQPANIVIGLSGKFNQKKAVEKIRKKFAFKATKSKNKYQPIAIIQNSPQVNVLNKDTEQVQLAIGFPAYSYFDKQIYALQVLSIILGGNMSSRLFLKVREKNGLAYFINSSLSIYQDTGALVIQAGVDKKRTDKAVELIIFELERVKGGISAEELKRAKEYLAGKVFLDLEDTSNLSQWNAKQELLTDEILTPDEKIAKIRAVTPEQIVAVAKKVIDLKKINLAVIGPFTDENYFERLIEV